MPGLRKAVGRMPKVDVGPHEAVGWMSEDGSAGCRAAEADTGGLKPRLRKVVGQEAEGLAERTMRRLHDATEAEAGGAGTED